MSTVGKALIESVQLTTTSTDTAYHCGNVRTRIDKCTACNTSAGAVVVTVYLITTGGSSGATNTVTAARSIAAGETYTFPEVVGHWLSPASSSAAATGDRIEAKADTATAVAFRVSGIEVAGT